jgi:hypothetical protein
VFQQPPIKTLAEPTRPRRRTRRPRVENEPVGDAVIGRDRCESAVFSTAIAFITGSRISA